MAELPRIQGAGFEHTICPRLVQRSGNFIRVTSGYPSMETTVLCL